MGSTTKTKSDLIAENERLRSRLAKLEAAEKEREEVKKAFNESEERYRSVFENTGTATIIIEADMTILKVNAQFVRMSGYSRKEIEGRMKWPLFVVEADVERMKRYHRKRRQDSAAAPKEYACQVKSRFGEVKDMLVSIDMIPGTLTSVASFMDVTAFKRTESALMESERKLSKLMSHLPGMAYRCMNDETRTMIFVSDGCEGLTGYAKKELIHPGGKPFISLIHGEDRKRVLETVRNALISSQSYQLEYRMTCADGTIKWVWDEGLGIVADDGEIDEMEGFISDITDYKLEELQLRKENIHLKSSIRERYKFGDIIGKNPAMQEVYERISKAAATDANVIIYGESGTGKELVARAIHRLSDNSKSPFVAVNCSAIPESLFESEFFGYKKGAFTGASTDKPGYFDIADGGTLFLDELGEIDLNAQAKLLRVIEGSGYTPVGGRAVKNANVRIIGATNRDLKEEVSQGRMREDFFYRIHIIPITLPTLRERKDDLPLLIDHFMSKYAESDSAPPITGKVLDALYRHDWPGNVRELQNVLQRYVTLKTLDFMSPAADEPVSASAVADGIDDAETIDLSEALGEFEKRLIRDRLERFRWQKGRTADALGVNRKTLFRKMKKYGLE